MKWRPQPIYRLNANTPLELTTLDDDDSTTCDWGNCGEPTVYKRYDESLDMWVPVCKRHSMSEEREP